MRQQDDQKWTILRPKMDVQSVIEPKSAFPRLPHRNLQPLTTLDNDHLKVEPFIPFLEKVSSAIDGALVEIVPQGRGIVSIELLKEDKLALE